VWNIAGKSTLLLGLCLFAINIVGLFISLRNESIYKEKTEFANDIILSEKEFYQKVNKPIVDKKEYVVELNQAVNQGIAHYWRDEGINKYNIRIPLHENYLLFIAGYLDPEEYRKYEFVDYRKAIERGIGLCSQQAIIMSEILMKKNIPSFITGLSGHVVLRAQVDENRDEWWVLDPDYGIIIPYDIDFIENDPKVIRPFYEQAGYNQKQIDLLENIYAKEGNVVSKEQGARGYQFKRFRDEPRFYFFKWVIPIILIVPALIRFCFKKKDRKKKSADDRERPTILFAIGSLEIGGAEKQLALLIKYLAEMNFACHLFALECSGPLKASLQSTNIVIYDGGYFSKKSAAVKIFLLIRAELRLLQVIRKISPNVVHAYLPLVNFMASVAARIAHVPLIITSKRALGTHQDRSRGWRIFDVLSFRFSHWVTVNSRAVEEDTIQRDMGNASKIKIIYNGLELEDFMSQNFDKRTIREALKIDPDKKIMITVANLIPYKGHIELLEAAAVVLNNHPDSLFLLVGEDRGILRNLEKLSRTIGIMPNVIFMGQRNDIPRLLAASDIAVLPSHEEGFSNVILESMAAGLPVVATRVGGNPEAVIDGETGWLVAPHRPTELALKIMDLLSEPEKARSWGEYGRQVVKEKFAAEKMVEAYLELYSLST
jgi:glycosyltransferase involved in cell wall biosynthesis